MSSSQRAHFFFSLVFKLLQIDPSGGKGSLTYGLGADFCLPRCLATGIRTFDLKAITWQNSRGNIVYLVRRSGATSRGTAPFCLFLSQMRFLESINTNKDMVQVDFAIFLALKLFRK